MEHAPSWEAWAEIAGLLASRRCAASRPMLAGQKVVEAIAARQLASAKILPTLNAGINYNDNTGNLQQSSGNILSAGRSALYAGARASAIGSRTVNVPGVL